MVSLGAILNKTTLMMDDLPLLEKQYSSASVSLRDYRRIKTCRFRPIISSRFFGFFWALPVVVASLSLGDWKSPRISFMPYENDATTSAIFE